MSIVIKCDMCGVPISHTETCNVFRMWNGVRAVQIEAVGLQGVPFDEDFYLCDGCMEKAWELLMNLKVVE